MKPSPARFFNAYLLIGPLFDKFFGLFLQLFFYEGFYVLIRELIKVVVLVDVDKEVVPFDKGTKASLTLGHPMAFVGIDWRVGLFFLGDDL